MVACRPKWEQRTSKANWNDCPRAQQMPLSGSRWPIPTDHWWIQVWCQDFASVFLEDLDGTYQGKDPYHWPGLTALWSDNAQGKTVKYKHCDNTPEHGNMLATICKDCGITIKFTAPYIPQHNGMDKQKTVTNCDCALAMLFGAQFDNFQRSFLKSQAWFPSCKNYGLEPFWLPFLSTAYFTSLFVPENSKNPVQKLLLLALFCC